jgi:hypothetical protein
MDAYANAEELNSAAEPQPEGSKRGRRRKNPLVEAIRALNPTERRQAIDTALQEVLEDERRQELLQKVQMLSTADLERLLGR